MDLRLDLATGRADLELERALVIPAASLVHLVTGRRNTLGQGIRHIGVRQETAIGFLDARKLRRGISESHPSNPRKR